MRREKTGDGILSPDVVESARADGACWIPGQSERASPDFAFRPLESSAFAVSGVNLLDLTDESKLQELGVPRSMCCASSRFCIDINVQPVVLLQWRHSFGPAYARNSDPEPAHWIGEQSKILCQGCRGRIRLKLPAKLPRTLVKAGRFPGPGRFECCFCLTNPIRPIY